MSIGIRSSISLAANQAVAASTVLVTVTGFSITLAALQKVHCRLWLPFSLGATGGFKFQWTPPASPGALVSQMFVQDNTTAGVQTVFYGGVQTSSTAFANAAAVAGNYLLSSEASYTNGVVAGAFVFQLACNSAANAITALAGSWMDITLV